MKNIARIVISSLFFCFLLVENGCDKHNQETATTIAKIQTGDSAADAEIILPISPETIHQQVLSHKSAAHVLWSWGSWCEPCLKNLPGIIALHNEYKVKNVDVLIISWEINTPTCLRNSRSILAANHVDFPTYVMNEHIPEDWATDTSSHLENSMVAALQIDSNTTHFISNLYRQFNVPMPAKPEEWAADKIIDRDGNFINISDGSADSIRVGLAKIGIAAPDSVIATH